MLLSGSTVSVGGLLSPRDLHFTNWTLLQDARSFNTTLNKSKWDPPPLFSLEDAGLRPRFRACGLGDVSTRLPSGPGIRRERHLRIGALDAGLGLTHKPN